MNIEVLIGLAIATSMWQNNWTPGTSMEEVLEQDPEFAAIREQADNNLSWLESGLEIELTTALDVVEAIWAGSEEDYEELL
jgi:hypothetical protein